MFLAPFKGGQTLFLGVFSALGDRFGLISFAMSQKSPASSLDTPQRVSTAREKTLVDPLGQFEGCRVSGGQFGVLVGGIQT